MSHEHDRGTSRVRHEGQQHTEINLEKYAADGNRFLNDVADELRVSRGTAARITRCVLHALRDRMPPDDAVEFAQGLPMALKGLYFDQYDLSDSPVVIRKASEFLDFIAMKDGDNASYDFPDRRSIEEGLRGVFRVLEDYLDRGQTESVKEIVGKEIRDLL
jgi:uncharacterized protein (DUF2267 family)